MRGKLIITGAGGFVGSHLAVGLAQLGFTPVLIDAAFDKAVMRRLEPLECVHADLQDVKDIGSADYLIHGAALTATPAELGMSHVEHLALNTSLTLAALRLAERCEVRRAVVLSSAGVFTPQQLPPLDEASPPDGAGVYATAKRIAELAVKSVEAEGNLDAVVVRLGNLYGPGEMSRRTRPRVSLVQRFINAAMRGQAIRLTTPEALREWTYIGDLAPAIAKLLESAHLPDTTFHLTSPETLTDRQLASEIVRHLESTTGSISIEEITATKPEARPPLLSRYSKSLELEPWTPFSIGLGRVLRDTSTRVPAEVGA